MAVTASYFDVLLSLRDGFERFATKTDEAGRALETELRHLLEEWDERVQKARQRERECQSDFDDAQRYLRWCQSKGDLENPLNCSYEQVRVEQCRRALREAQAHSQLVNRSARELQMACEAFQKHGRALRQVATQTAPNASSRMNALLRDLEHYSYVPSASGVSHASIGGATTSPPPLEQMPSRNENSQPSTAYQARISSSVRELAALLRGLPTASGEGDAAQIELAGRRLRSITELAPEAWNGLPESQRVAALCSVERIMAELQGRPPVSLVIESQNENTWGGYDPQKGHISLNPSFVLRIGAREIVEVITHMGRHAYQAYAMHHPNFHPDSNEVGRWRINNLYYLRADVWGAEAYRNQPVESDAISYAEAVCRQLFGDAR